MQKIIFVLIILTLCLIISFSYAYSLYNSNINNTKKFNSEFEIYFNKEIKGSDIATIMNKAINNNEKHNISKDKKGNYIEDDEYSVKIDIFIDENNQIYSMETINKLTIKQFVDNFGAEKFKCEKIEYHHTTKRIKYMLFKQQLI